MVPSKPSPLVSSSSTLWATASKEWIIQPKPKPGRKPKKDVVAPTKTEDQLDNKGRRVQNRAAQRAFRERKQSQLAELQARVQSYEQGEIERNVALQNIAKRLKDENEALRLENSLLKERMLKVEKDQETTQQHDRKRWRDDSPMSNGSLAPPTANKRAKISTDSPRTIITTSYTPSPPSMVSSPDSNGTSDTRFSPLPYETHSDSNPSQLSNIMDFSSNAKQHAIENNDGFPAFDCGFCNEDTPCVCREIAVQQAAERLGVVDFKAESYSQTSPLLHINQTIRLETAPVAPRTSILENLPAYQPPVPLRRRQGVPAVNSVFPVAPPPPVLQRVPAPDNCSGDPSNCMACADDAFGKAFCLAIEESVSTQAPCGDCPCSQDRISHTSRNSFISISGPDCCTNPASCDCPTNANRSSTSHNQPESKTIPTNDAWRQIKSHPNVAFTDLALLADVVARRSKCTGPKVVISPALGSATPERSTSPGLTPANPHTSDQGPVLLTDPHAHYHERERARSSGPSPPPPTLVPQEVLLRCGRRRVREVQADAVQAALRLLDAKFS